MLSEVFLTFAVSSFIGCVLGIVTFCYRSKCREFNFCGCKIVRDVQLEEEFDLEMMKNKNSEVKTQENI